MRKVTDNCVADLGEGYGATDGQDRDGDRGIGGGRTNARDRRAINGQSEKEREREKTRG